MTVGAGVVQMLVGVATSSMSNPQVSEAGHLGPMDRGLAFLVCVVWGISPMGIQA